VGRDAELQYDGNFVLYSSCTFQSKDTVYPQTVPVFATSTNTSDSTEQLTMQNDGNLVLWRFGTYNVPRVLWASNTVGL
jgi:hypothetical protein